MSEKKLYFAYGSNINLEQMAIRCPAARPLMPVVLEDYTLVYRGIGVATVVPERDSVVNGLLWIITPSCEKALDRYEGYPHLYHKTDVTVTDPNTGEIYHTMMYEMDERYKEPAIPSPYYYSIIEEGYKQNNMDTRSLRKSLGNAEKEMQTFQKQMLFNDLPKEWLSVTKRAQKRKDNSPER